MSNTAIRYPRGLMATRVMASALMAMGLGLLSLPAQEAQRPSPEELLEAKLDSAFLKKADWVLGYDLAMKRAREAKKPILGYFTTAGY
jgi:hypothetical protein